MKQSYHASPALRPDPADNCGRLFCRESSGVWRPVVFFTLPFSLLAHGYRYLSLSYSGDAMLISQAGEELYQISLGRFLQPVYWQIRGYIAAPLTVGLFATGFLIICCAVVVHLLELRRPLHIALTCAVLATNETFAASNATYLPWTDVYMLAMAFSLLGTYLFFRSRHGWLISPLLYCLSVGLYQSYLPTAAALVILVLIRRTLKGEKASSVFACGIRACVSLVLGLLLYALVLQIILRFAGVEASQDYNGVANVGRIAADEILSLLASTYTTPLSFLFNPSGAPAMPWHLSSVPALLNALIFSVSGLLLLSGAGKLRLSSAFMLLFLVLVLPLGVNFIQFIAQGTASGLTIYAYYFLYLIPVMLPVDEDVPSLPVRILSGAAVLLLCAFVFVNVRNSNAMAVKRDLEYASTTSAMTRLIDTVEQTADYIPGETPVAIIGFLPSSAISMERPGFEDIARVQGMRYTYGAAYETSTAWYLQMALGEPLNLVSPQESAQIISSEKALSMPAFPYDGFCQMVDGTLYIKISP